MVVTYEDKCGTDATIAALDTSTIITYHVLGGTQKTTYPNDAATQLTLADSSLWTELICGNIFIDVTQDSGSE